MAAGQKSDSRCWLELEAHRRWITVRLAEEVRRRVTATFVSLDPIRLLQTIRIAQQELVDIADRPTASETAAPTRSTLGQFLSGLRTAWRDGEVRPTNRPKQKAPRGRRRPDPFVSSHGAGARMVRDRAMADIAGMRQYGG